MAKKFFYSLYSANGEELLGTYDSVSDFVSEYYNLSKENQKFSSKRNVVYSVVSRKKKTKKPRKWILVKMSS